jgi:hypothetical protein
MFDVSKCVDAGSKGQAICGLIESLSSEDVVAMLDHVRALLEVVRYTAHSYDGEVQTAIRDAINATSKAIDNLI